MIPEEKPSPPGMDSHSAADLLPATLQRFIPAITAILIGVALFGFLRGIAERKPAHKARQATRSDTGSEVLPAARYQDMRAAGGAPGQRWHESLADLKYHKPGVFDPVVRTEEMKQVALADRAVNRAYEGAPPTIPHPVDQPTAVACLVCHGQGLKVGERVASKVSHPHFSNCTQCHVEQRRGGLPFPAEAVENAFVGVFRAGPGTRASPGAPPTIPHTTWLREDCLSCHGLVARPGIRTTHPWLSNCTQCHAPSADRDQVDFLQRLSEKQP